MICYSERDSIFALKANVFFKLPFSGVKYFVCLVSAQMVVFYPIQEFFYLFCVQVLLLPWVYGFGFFESFLVQLFVVGFVLSG